LNAVIRDETVPVYFCQAMVKQAERKQLGLMPFQQPQDHRNNSATSLQ